MSPRERVLITLNHNEPDRVPIDLGSCVSGIAVISYNKLKEKLGIETKTEVIDKAQQLAKLDEEILRKFNVDTRHIWPKPNTLKKEDNPYIDEWGIKRKMPKGGYYYDMVENPLAGANISRIKKYKGPAPEELGITKELGRLLGIVSISLLNRFSSINPPGRLLDILLILLYCKKSCFNVPGRFGISVILLEFKLRISRLGRCII